MLIYSHIDTSRIRYALDLVFTDVLRLSYRFTTDKVEFGQSQEPKLAYTTEKLSNGFFIGSHPLLAESGIKSEEPEVFHWNGLPAFFKTRGDLPFDLFACSFYLATRYEEYVGFRPDTFGRYPASRSLACKYGFLHRPVINLWAHELKELLTRRYPQLQFSERTFRAVMTFDIDVAYAFQGRSFQRNILASLNDVVLGRLKNLRSRVACLSGIRSDPYDTYDYIIHSLKGTGIHAIFFFLVGKKNNKYDRNLNPGSAWMRHLVKRISSSAETGVHPSYFSSEKHELIMDEKNLLQQLTGYPVTKSRQHYLRFHIPATLIELQRLGITDDYSMGYAALPGFRAGLCTPFRFYNLLTEEPLEIRIHPITCMDGAFIEDMQLTPEESIAKVKRLVDEVAAVNGEFIGIWHNHTVSDHGLYKGWRSVYESSIQYLKEKL